MKKFLILVLVSMLYILFPAKSDAQSFNRSRSGLNRSQPYYNGLNGYGTYYSRGGNNSRSFTYSYPVRPYGVYTPYGGYQTYSYGNGNFSGRNLWGYPGYQNPDYQYQYRNGYSGYIYPW
jgi:hypothetical protein